MIDRTQINTEKLLTAMLDDHTGNVNRWWRLVEFIKDYMPPYPRPETRPVKWSIKCGESYLRDFGKGMFVWDIHYGDDSDFYSPEYALLALMRAPVPPWLLKPEVWESEQRKPTTETK